MSLDLFRLAGGIDITSDNLSTHVNILQGAGAPGGDTGQQDAAPIGSLYLRTDLDTHELQVYWKTTSFGATSDWEQATSKNYVDAAINGLHWRDPVVVLDNTSYASSANFPVTGTVDGVVLTDGARVLFSNVTAVGESNVWIWNATGSSWSIDPITTNTSDAVLVTSGTAYNQQWTYNGTAWVLFNAYNDEEVLYLRSYVGKPAAGSVLPIYTTKYLTTTSAPLLASINAIDTALGVGTITNTGGNYVLQSSLAFSGTNGAAGSTTITAAIDLLNSAIGNRTYTTGTNYPITASGQAVATSLESLNVSVHNIIVDTLQTKGSISSTPATFQMVDAVPFTLASEVKWIVQIRDTGTPANIRACEVHAVTDGTNTDFTRYGDLTLGAGVVGFGLQVLINGANLELQLRATNNYDFSVKRVAVSKF